MIRERWLYDFWILFISVVRHGVCSVTDGQPSYNSVYIAEILPNFYNANYTAYADSTGRII